MKLYLIRHGETEANRKKIYAGVSPYALNEKGRGQAARLQNYFQKLDNAALLSSPLLRCKETVSLIKFSQPVAWVAGFREINFGLWENLSFSEIQSRYPQYMAEWTKNPWTFTFPQGECMRDYYHMVIEAFKKNILTASGQDKIIIAHKGVFSCILTYLLTGSHQLFWQFHFDCGSYSIIEIIDSNAYVHAINRHPK